MAETPNEFQLKNPPTDGVTAVKFGPNSSQFLLSSSWDTSVRLYDVISNHLRMKYNHPAPVLDCCFHVSKRARAPRFYSIKVFPRGNNFCGNFPDGNILRAREHFD